MVSLKRSCVLLCALGAVGLVGCGPKMDKDTIKNMKPERPVELSMLDRFVGEWQGTSQCTMRGSEEAMQGSGTSTMTWDLENMVLVEKSEYSGDMGAMKSMGIWSWDAKHDRFRITWLDSWGSYGQGWSQCAADGKTWKMRAKSCSPWGTSIGKGTMTFVDNNTMEFTWAEYCCMGLIKTMEMKGTSTRQPAAR